MTTTSRRGQPKSKFLSAFSMCSRTHLEGNRVKRWIWMISWSCLAVGVAVSLRAPRPAGATAIGPAYAALNADPPPGSSAEAKEPGEGVLNFEVEPDDVEIYLDNHYLGKAGELRGRALRGIRAGNRLVELRRGAERTFLQVVVPINETKIIRVAPVAAPASAPVPARSTATQPITLAACRARFDAWAATQSPETKISLSDIDRAIGEGCSDLMFHFDDEAFEKSQRAYKRELDKCTEKVGAWLEAHGMPRDTKMPLKDMQAIFRQVCPHLKL